MLLNKKLDKRLVGLLAGVVCYGLSASVAQAVMIDEDSPDAGELLSDFQDTTGTGAVLESISGTLINLGTTANPIDDIDLYKILITDPDAFSVMVTATLSDDNDAMLYLFDAGGLQVLVDDCNESTVNCLGTGTDPLPQFNTGDLAADAGGMYFLAFNLFITNPFDTSPPGLDNGWFRDPIPTGQTGEYVLALTGVATAPRAVPEPGTLALFGLGLAGMGLARRRMKA